jgi:hypothetical protein
MFTGQGFEPIEAAYSFPLIGRIRQAMCQHQNFQSSFLPSVNCFLYYSSVKLQVI